MIYIIAHRRWASVQKIDERATTGAKLSDWRFSVLGPGGGGVIGVVTGVVTEVVTEVVTGLVTGVVTGLVTGPGQE